MENVQEKYKEFLEVVPEEKKNLALMNLGFEERFPREYRQGCLEREILDPNVQMPRHEFLSRMNEDELRTISNFVEDFHESKGRKDIYQYAVLSVGSNIWDQEHKENIRNFFKEAGYGPDDYVDEGVVELECEAEEHQKERRLTVRQILNNEHNDIDLLFLPDPVIASPRISYNGSITPYKDKFYDLMKSGGYDIRKEGGHWNGEGYMRNPDGNEIMRMKTMVYGSDTLNFLDYDPNSRPIHAYFRDHYAETKTKSDLVDEIPFSVLFRRANIGDLQLAIWNGLGRGVFENPVYEHLLDKNE